MYNAINKECDQEVVKKCLDYMRDNKRYSIEQFLKDNNLLEGSTMRGENIWIKCPFHEDADPSMSINFEKNIYKCFANCGHQGGYMNFVVDYYKEILGKNVNFYSLLDTFLKEDVGMRTVVQATTVYRKVKAKTDLKNYKRFKPDLGSKSLYPRTYLELAHRMKRDKKITINDKIMMISLMQASILPGDIYKEIYNIKDDDVFDASEIDIADIIGGN